MPELPEVETIVQGLQPVLGQQRISDLKILLPKIIRSENERPVHLISKKIINVFRFGKNIIIQLSGERYLRIHLKMTGQLLINKPTDPVQKHTHVIFGLENEKNEKLELRYRDLRQFGYIQILTDKEWDTWLKNSKLGPDPLEISFPSFSERLRNKRGKIKAVLLDQGFLRGLGNIYVDEILHLARINPETPAFSLSEEFIQCLYQAMRTILQAAIQQKGSSVRNYVEASGERGQYQRQHRVYGRAGLPCLSCGSEVKKIRVAGRGTCFCPQCQR